MLNKGQLVTNGGFCSLVGVNVVSVIWRWPDYQVFGWFALIWLALACFTFMYLIVNNNRKWSFGAFVVCVVGCYMNCYYLNEITEQV